jgi:hypothetical protein
MRHTFLISTAAAALVAGTVFAAAQSSQKQAPSSGAMERGAPSQMQGEQTQGQDQSRPGERKGQAQDQKSKQSQPKTTGQGQGKQEGQTQQREQSQPKAGQGSQQGQTPTQSRDQGTQTQQRQQDQTQQGQGQRQQGAQQQSGSGSASFTTEQRTKIRETVLRSGNAPKVTNVNFSVRVGTVVPTSVRVVEVPDVIIEVHPEWRGFMYFVYNDEIIIVDKSHKIVAVITV